MNALLRKFVLGVLDDDHGISEKAWGDLQELLQGQGEMEFIGELLSQVDACDGRFFINSREPDQEPDQEPDEDDSVFYAAPV